MTSTFTFFKRGLPLISIVWLSTVTAQSQAQNAVLNGNFESVANLLPGQTPVGPNESKILFESTAIAGFAPNIRSVPSWTNSYTNVGFGSGFRDAGLSRLNFAGSGSSQYAFINNWNTRLSQVSSINVLPNQSVTASIDIGMDGPSKGGRFQLWAGRPSLANPDVFDVGSILLSEVTVGSAGWGGFVPNVIVPIGQWTSLTVNYTSPSSGSMIGQALTLSFITSSGSAGPTFWDNATLIPSPASAAFFGLGGLLASRRRR